MPVLFVAGARQDDLPVREGRQLREKNEDLEPMTRKGIGNGDHVRNILGVDRPALVLAFANEDLRLPVVIVRQDRK